MTTSFDEASSRPLYDSLAKIEIPIPATDIVLTVNYQSPEIIDDEPNARDLKHFLEASLQVVFQELGKVFQNENVFSTFWMLQIYAGDKFQAQGSLMYIPLNDLKDAYDSEVGSDVRKLFLSRVAHEVGHNLMDEESIPMLIELYFLIMTSYNTRIERIGNACANNEFPKEYLQGIEQIRKWFNAPDIHTLFANIIKGVITLEMILATLKNESINELKTD
ncbi:MAG: hypothetical protein GW947_01040 [Candidatus Pacebacteria bacterium]|nr:hypothetical protein [Candidatus Paceibacterota bacterium]